MGKESSSRREGQAGVGGPVTGGGKEAINRSEFMHKYF